MPSSNPYQTSPHGYAGPERKPPNLDRTTARRPCLAAETTVKRACRWHPARAEALVGSMVGRHRGPAARTRPRTGFTADERRYSPCPGARPQWIVQAAAFRSTLTVSDTLRPRASGSRAAALCASSAGGDPCAYRCRSEPQIAVEVTRTTASVGASIFGSGTSSTDTRRRPCHVTAFMCSPGSRCPATGVPAFLLRRGHGSVPS
jgi:hypothetical protein